MLETFEKELDPHTVTATGLFHKEYKEITKQERKRGKSLNFAINYGTTEYGLERNFDIPKEEGKENIEAYFKFYTDYANYINFVDRLIWEKGYSTTVLGRKRFFERKIIFEPGYSKEYYKAKVLRALRNMIIQGTGADMVKLALVLIYRDNPFGNKLKVLLQIHDEIVLECDKDIANEAVAFVKEKMLEAEDSFLKVVKSKVDVKYSEYWEH
jgi:DNA polymerase-1